MRERVVENGLRKKTHVHCRGIIPKEECEMERQRKAEGGREGGGGGFQKVIKTMFIVEWVVD